MLSRSGLIVLSTSLTPFEEEKWPNLIHKATQDSDFFQISQFYVLTWRHADW